ncbi:MAG: hypothetical protein V3W19_03385 [Desulfatiglandales bacterium]
MIVELMELLGLFLILIISIGYRALSLENKAKVVFILDDDLVLAKKSWKGFKM